MRQFKLSCCGAIMYKVPYQCRSCESTSFIAEEVDKEDQVIQMGQLLSGCPIASGPSDVFVMHEVLDKIHGSISGSKEDRGAASNCCH